MNSLAELEVVGVEGGADAVVEVHASRVGEPEIDLHGRRDSVGCAREPPASYPPRMARPAPDPEVARVAAVLKLRFDDLVERLTDRIADEIDLYGSDAVVARAELRRSVADNFTFMLGQMSTSDDPDLGPPRRTGSRRAQEGAPLPELLRAYRLGFAFLLGGAARRGPRRGRRRRAGADRHRRGDPGPRRRLRHRAHRRLPRGRVATAWSPPTGTGRRWSRPSSPAA